MDFRFTEEQQLLRDGVRDFLAAECTPDWIRRQWESDDDCGADFWEAFAALGVLGVLAPEERGGLGLETADFILLAEECGRAGAPPALVETALSAVPLLAGLADPQWSQQLLGRVLSGSARVAVGAACNPFVCGASAAEVLLLQKDAQVWVLPREKALLEAQPSVDGGRRLWRVEWRQNAAQRAAAGAEGAALWALARERGALGCAAQQLGAARRALELAVAYTGERRQFGKPVGSFQAVKHLLADVAVRVEFAQAPLYRAAAALTADCNPQEVVRHVAHARLAVSEAARLAARNCLQAHGAMGYSWELDLHIWLKRIWALDGDWGGKEEGARLASLVLDAGQPLPSGSFPE